MGFSDRIQSYFEEKKLNNRKISQIMDGYSESMISRYIHSDELSAAFILKLLQYFPDIDFNWLLKGDTGAGQTSKGSDPEESENLEIIKRMRRHLETLEKNLSPR